MSDSADPFEAIRARFLHRLSEQRAEIARLMGEAGANSQIQDIAHKIAGIAGSLGYPELSRAASELEMLLVRESSAALPGSRQLEQLISQMDELTPRQ